jgi:riboflavin kinase/FMN adenylyltransferase
MIRVVGWKDFSGQQGPPLQVALTIGTFDSLHVGHQRLIRGVVDNGCGAIPAVCTFAQNPAKVLGSRPFPGSILSFAQKIEKLEALGVALVILIDFSVEISKLAGKSFLELLASRLDIRKLVVGYNFHMGRGRDTNAQELVRILTESEIELEIIPATLYGDQVVSSSRIRDLIRQGRFGEARKMLTDDFRLDLRGVSIGRRGGDSSVRRSEITQVLPPGGEYQVRFATEDRDVPGTVLVRAEELAWHREFAGTETEIRFLKRE